MPCRIKARHRSNKIVPSSRRNPADGRKLPQLDSVKLGLVVTIAWRIRRPAHRISVNPAVAARRRPDTGQSSRSPRQLPLATSLRVSRDDETRRCDAPSGAARPSTRKSGLEIGTGIRHPVETHKAGARGSTATVPRLTPRAQCLFSGASRKRFRSGGLVPGGAVTGKM